MKIIKSLALMMLLVCSSHCIRSYVLEAGNTSSVPVTIDFIGTTGKHWTRDLKPREGDSKNIHGECTQKVVVTVKKPNGGYGGEITVHTPGVDCQSFSVVVYEKNKNLCVRVKEGGEWESVGTGIARVGMFIPNAFAYVFLLGAATGYMNDEDVFSQYIPDPTDDEKEECLPLDALLKNTTENTIVINKTNQKVTLSNAPSLGGGEPTIDPTGILPFYLNSGSTNERLIIKGSGAGTLEIGNDYKKYKMHLDKVSDSIKTSNPQYDVIDGDGKSLKKYIRAPIQPLQKLNIKTPEMAWSIELIVGEPVK